MRVFSPTFAVGGGARPLSPTTRTCGSTTSGFSRLAQALMVATLGQDLSEPFELYSAPALLDRPLPVGQTPAALGMIKPRAAVHRDGDWHRSVHIWLTDGTSFLLQRRSVHKDTHPGLLDVSCAGHLSGSDASLLTAVKELDEELGFSATEAELAAGFVCTLPAQVHFYLLYIYICIHITIYIF